ncbi:hypothetical protein PSAR109036_00980 [Psychrobacter arenosus]|uniref:hypothetical protein n=1 Tax=Psychrobacter arenosus TaxID=256326 RepID=UPI00191A679D|nr:hypothetical protein [Psychrobacter arenosus]
MNETYETEILVNKWNLEDILTNMDTLNERLAHLSTLASMTNADSNPDQLRAVISAMSDSLYDIRIVAGHDKERLAEIISESLPA